MSVEQILARYMAGDEAGNLREEPAGLITRGVRLLREYTRLF